MMSPVLDEQALTSKEAAALLGVGEGTLRNWRSQGRGPDFMRTDQGRGIRYRLGDLRAWQKAHTISTARR